MCLPLPLVTVTSHIPESHPLRGWSGWWFSVCATASGYLWSLSWAVLQLVLLGNSLSEKVPHRRLSSNSLLERTECPRVSYARGKSVDSQRLYFVFPPFLSHPFPVGPQKNTSRACPSCLHLSIHAVIPTDALGDPGPCQGGGHQQPCPAMPCFHQWDSHSNGWQTEINRTKQKYLNYLNAIVKMFCQKRSGLFVEAWWKLGGMWGGEVNSSEARIIYFSNRSPHISWKFLWGFFIFKEWIFPKYMLPKHILS